MVKGSITRSGRALRIKRLVNPVRGHLGAILNLRSSSASLSCLARPFIFFGDLVGECPCRMSEAVLASGGAHDAEDAENVGQGVTPGDGGRAAGGCLDGDIENAVKGRLENY